MPAAFYDRGIALIDGSNERSWREGHIPNSIHLPEERNSQNATARKLTEANLREVAGKTDEIVFLWY